MPSRRILSNSNLAARQEVSVNPYNSFNSDAINRLTRIVSGGKNNDVVVDGLDTFSGDIKDWFISDNILKSFTDESSFISAGWNKYNTYILNFDGKTVIDFELPHQDSLSFSKIWCRLDDSKFSEYYGHDKEKEFEVSFDLEMGTPSSIIININSSKVVIDHPSSNRQIHYTAKFNRNFIKDRKDDGLIFTIGAVLDGADPECELHSEVSNKTYIRISNIELKVLGYNRKQWPVAIGPINGVYGLSGIHPLHTLYVTPGLAIKDDAMIEELGINEYDKSKVVELDPSDNSAWLNNKAYEPSDFTKTTSSVIQYAYQLNNTRTGFIRRKCHFDSNGNLKITIGDDKNSIVVDPIDDLQLSKVGDINFKFTSFEEDTDSNLILHYHNSNNFKITNGSNICIITQTINGSEHVLDYVLFECDNTGKVLDFNVTIDSSRLYGRIESLDDFNAYASIGPIKISGDPQLYNSDCVKWAYVVVYYSYFKNPKPNVSYIGLVREEDLNNIRYREDYLILAKVRFIDYRTIDIVSYENRQRKLLPRADKVNYSSTCNYPDIWYQSIPDSVTDAINYLAKFDVNLSRLITYKHDYDAEISTAFNIAKENSNDNQQTPFVSINKQNHLERRIRIDTSKLIVDSVYQNIPEFPAAGTQITYDSELKIYRFGNWALSFDQSVIDNINSDPMIVGNEVSIKAAFGPYDPVTKTLTNRYICFNSVGPFKFISRDDGSDAIKFNWLYDSDILLYPTAPSLIKSNGKYIDIDDGGYSDGYYASKKGSYNNTYILSYTPADGSTESSMNSDKNHFHYIKFRNDYLLSDRLLHLLDILPRNPEYLINKRVVIGLKDDNVANDQPHLQSSIHQLDDDMIDNHLLVSNRDDNDTNHIHSSKFVIDPNLDNNCVLTSEDTGTDKPYDEVTVKSTNVILEPSGENKILVSNKIDGTDIFKITSSNYTIGDILGYWFKPKISYYPSENAARILMDCSKNYIVRVSEILKTFDIKEAKTNSVTIKSVDHLNANKTRYYYTPVSGNNPEVGMYVSTNSSVKSTKKVSNTISSDYNQFAKVSAVLNDQAKTIIVKEADDYTPYNETYGSKSELELTIMPTKDSSFYSNIVRIEKSDTNRYKIYYGIKNDKGVFVNGLTSIDDFVVKAGMKIYTAGLKQRLSSGEIQDHNIYRYNYLYIRSVGKTSSECWVEVTIDDEVNSRGFGYYPSNIEESKVYFINTDDVIGIYPLAIIDTVTRENDSDIITFSDQKYTTVSSINNGTSVYGGSVLESKSLDISEIVFNDDRTIQSITVPASTFKHGDTLYFHQVINGMLDGECMYSKIGADVAKISIAANSNEATIILGKENSHVLPDVASYKHLYTYIKNNIVIDGSVIDVLIINQDNAVKLIQMSNLNNSQAAAADLPIKTSKDIPLKYTQIKIPLSGNVSQSIDFSQDLAERVADQEYVSMSFFYRYVINRVDVDESNNNATYISLDAVDTSIEPDCMVMTSEDEGVIYNNEINATIPLEIEKVGKDSIGDYFEVSKQDSFDSNDIDLIATSEFKTLRNIISASKSDDIALCNIRIDVDITNLKDEPFINEKDGYSAIDRYFEGKIVIINDLDTDFDGAQKLASKKFVKLSFAVLDNYQELDDSASDDESVKSNQNPTRIIWKDEYRGYNKSVNESTNSSYHDLHPVNLTCTGKGIDDSGHEIEITAMAPITSEYSIVDKALSGKAGFGSSRGPIYSLYAGIQSEFNFKFVRTIPDLPIIDDEEYQNVKLKQIRDVIYAQSHMYYINNEEESASSNQMTVTYCAGVLSFSDGSKKKLQTISNPKTTDKYIFPTDSNNMITGDYWKDNYSWKYINDVIDVNNPPVLKTLINHNIICYAESKTVQLKFFAKDTDTNPVETRTLTIVSANRITDDNWTVSEKAISLAIGSDGKVKSSFPVVSNAGYVLTGWNYVKGSLSSVCSIDDTVSKFWKYCTETATQISVSIYASWSHTGINVTLKDGNNTIEVRSYDDADTIYGNLPRNLTKIGYEFIGWFYNDIEIKDTTVINTISIVSHTLNAKWKANVLVVGFDPHLPAYKSSIPKKHLIKQSFAYNSSVTSAEYDGRYGDYNLFDIGNLPTLPQCSEGQTSYIFDGWYFEPTLINHIVDTTKVSALYSHVLYAKWLVNKPVVITCDYSVFGEGSKQVTLSYNEQSVVLTPENNKVEVPPRTIITASTPNDTDKIFFLNSEEDNLYRNNYSFIAEDDISLTCVKINDHGTYSYNGKAHTAITDFVHNGSLIGGFKYIMHFYDTAKYNRINSGSKIGHTETQEYQYVDSDFNSDSFASICHKGTAIGHKMHMGIVYQDDSIHIKDMYQNSDNNYPYYIDNENNQMTTLSYPDKSTVDLKDTTFGGNGISISYVTQNYYLSVYFKNTEFDFTNKHYSYRFQPGFTLQDNDSSCTGIKCDISYILKIEGEENVRTTTLSNGVITVKDSRGNIIS